MSKVELAEELAGRELENGNGRQPRRMMRGRHFVRSGNEWDFRYPDTSQRFDRLPPQNYTVAADPLRGFYLREADPFVLPEKVYGSCRRQADRFLSTFNHRELSTGVLLNGDKGSGKSLTAKLTCVMAAERHQMPTLIVGAPWHGDSFNEFLQQIEQPCVVFIDEFEKTYRDQTHQEAMLTLLDGVVPMHKLFLLTVNDSWKVNENMRNRPGRIYYSVPFGGLSEEFVMEYGRDNLVNQEHLQELIQLASLYYRLNFDMLQAVVDESNRYQESPLAAVELLNARPDTDGLEFRMTCTKNGEELAVGNARLSTHPMLIQNLRVQVYQRKKGDYETLIFPRSTLAAVSPGQTQFVYRQGGYEVTVARPEPKVYNLHESFSAVQGLPASLAAAAVEPQDMEDF